MKLGGTTTVICALGQRPRWNVAQELCDCAPRVRVIGDSNAFVTITKATALRWISDRVFYQTGPCAAVLRLRHCPAYRRDLGAACPPRSLCIRVGRYRVTCWRFFERRNTL